MTVPLRGPRPSTELWADDAGQAITEWTILTATVVFPLAWVGKVSLELLDVYFYRVAGLISLPFP